MRTGNDNDIRYCQQTTNDVDRRRNEDDGRQNRK